SSGAYHFSDAATETIKPAALGQAAARSRAAAGAAAVAAAAPKGAASTMRAPEPTFHELARPETHGTLQRSLTRTFYVFVVFILAILLLGGIYVRRRAARTQAQQITPTVLPPAPVENRPEDEFIFDATETDDSPRARSSKANASPANNPPKPTMGEQALTSTPSGAQIEIDGRGEATWKTPFTASALVAGPHNVTFRKQGYATETRIVEVASGKKGFVNAQLRPTTGRLAISSEPEGAVIILDGKDSGKVTPVQLTLDQGQHTLGMRKNGHRELSTSVNLRT